MFEEFWRRIILSLFFIILSYSIRFFFIREKYKSKQKQKQQNNMVNCVILTKITLTNKIKFAVTRGVKPVFLAIVICYTIIRCSTMTISRYPFCKRSIRLIIAPVPFPSWRSLRPIQWCWLSVVYKCVIHKM